MKKNSNNQYSFVLRITFSKSSSKNYKKAVNLASGINKFIPASEKTNSNAIVISDLNEFKDKIRTIENIWTIICGWKTSQFIFSKECLNKKEIYDLFRIVSCSKNYAKAVIPENHCKIWGEKEGWGCKHLTFIKRNLEFDYYRHRGAYWYEFGHFETPELWKIDKAKLLTALKKEVKLNRVELCEVFKIEKLENIVKSLPSEISVKNTEDWSVEYEDVLKGTKINKTPTRIKHISTRGESYGGLSASLNISLGDVSKKAEEPNKKEERNIPDVKFSEIGGIDDIIENIREVIELPLIQPEIFLKLGIRPHRGILLYGPPGCGKTLIAKAIANEVGAHFILVNGPEIRSKWYGESEQNIRNIFLEAKKLQPSVIYWDEFDSLMQSRSSEVAARYDSSLVNQLLTLMDGVEEYGNICVMASTNRKELIDDALLRPGRFDYCIEIKKPTLEGCKNIFEISTRTMPISKNFDKQLFSNKLLGLSGAEIAFVSREAAYNCFRRNFVLEKVRENPEIYKEKIKDLEIIEDDFNLALIKIKSQNKE
ncbi:MAG: AAA family ATPase [Candidatus Omnitrophota bacterium]|nr:AAA family ATPase [Candidatus Omnitrophota bacterium]